VTAQLVIALLLAFGAFAIGRTLRRRRAYREAARSVWPAETNAEPRTTLPAARLPAASRRALKRRQRANRADLAHVLGRPRP
jgi:hypothetical protein